MYLLLIGLFYLLYFLYLKSNQENNNNTATTQKKKPKKCSMFSKFVLAVLVLSLILPKTSQYIKWIVSAGLAQVSEFSFVLGSRARRAGIISREVSYFIVINFAFCISVSYWDFILQCIWNTHVFGGISKLLANNQPIQMETCVLDKIRSLIFRSLNFLDLKY